MTLSPAPIPATSIATGDIVNGDCRTAMPMLGLIDILIPTSGPPRGLVDDWFAGSDAASEACRLSGRLYRGGEPYAAMAEKARARIAAVLPLGGGSPA